MPFIEELNPYVKKVRSHSHILSELDSIWKDFEGEQTIVDLGCGNGHFLEEYLELNPEILGLGVERRFKRCYKAAEKILNLGKTDKLSRDASKNSRIIQTDIREFYEKSPSEFWNEVWLQFPDPWPKLKHEKHRGVNRKNFESIHRVLKTGGRFCFRSDSVNYFEILNDLQLKLRLFSNVETSTTDLFSSYPSTLYQKKFVARGVPIYSIQFRK